MLEYYFIYTSEIWICLLLVNYLTGIISIEANRLSLGYRHPIIQTNCGVIRLNSMFRITIKM
jgi:hypothetical protein